MIYSNRCCVTFCSVTVICKYLQYLHCMIVSKILCSINAYKTFSIISRGFKLLKNDCLNINDILCFRRDRLHFNDMKAVQNCICKL
ncbi:hypothetical protein HN011_001235 [Eciton burchellii]|nr:hypothetical protein HN011_001235 [Eciton burchellii]